jgi:hypothetical protein
MPTNDDKEKIASKTPVAREIASIVTGIGRGQSPPPKPEPYKPYVKPGEQLHYVDKLKERGQWPPKRAKYGTDGQRGPTTIPFLVVPAMAFDPGLRPISDDQALYNQNLQILDPLGHPVLAPVAGTTYRIRASVTNRGGCGAFGGLAEFHIAPAATIDHAAAVPGTTFRALGYAGFSAAPGATVNVDCPNPWTPANAAEANNSVVVQAYDAFLDLVAHRFDARQDRHIGRRDHIPNFAGVWDGFEIQNNSSYKIRIIITQNGLTVNASFYMQLSGSIPSTPQDSASGTITGGHVQMNSTETWGPSHVLFTSNHWTLSITPAGLLHFDHHRHFLMPGDTRPDADSHGDLQRV